MFAFIYTGRSGTRKKKGGSNHTSSTVHANGGVVLDSSIFLKRAHELKEEGNKRFQNKDFVGALEQYESALRLTPKTYPDRAEFHSNRAACLMQMKAIDYDTVIADCTTSLQVQPQFVRALLRRARAFEAIGNLKKKGGSNRASLAVNSTPNANEGVDLDSSICCKEPMG